MVLCNLEFFSLRSSISSSWLSKYIILSNEGASEISYETTILVNESLFFNKSFKISFLFLLSIAEKESPVKKLVPKQNKEQ